jgi:hypothetical protein
MSCRNPKSEARQAYLRRRVSGGAPLRLTPNWMWVLSADPADRLLHLDSQLALCHYQARSEHGLRQQKRPAEPERVANKLADSNQDAANREQEGGGGTHESEDNRQSAVKQTAQERPDRVSRAHRTSAIAVSRAPDTRRRLRDILRY